MPQAGPIHRMRFGTTEIDGVWILEPERIEDERGFFARTWDAAEVKQHGLSGGLVQCSISHNTRLGTLRGMHYQAAPHEETKVVRCTTGAIFDVAVDLRPASPTFTSWFGIELSAENRLALYIPKGCAHGFLTLQDDTEVLYQMTAVWVPEAARGVRFDDPAFGIAWPGDALVINERDRCYPDFEVRQ